MKAFLNSNAGKGTVGVYLAGLLLAWPPALSWLVAAVMLAFAIRQFRESFRQLDAEQTGHVALARHTGAQQRRHPGSAP